MAYVNAIVESVHTKNVERVLIAKALVDPSCGQIPLRLANITGATCELAESDLHPHEATDRILMKVIESTDDDFPAHLKSLRQTSSKLLSD